MYHYDPLTALEELKEEALLPNPVRVRDMMARAHLTPAQSLDINRVFQDYLQAFGNAQEIANAILKKLAR